TRRGDRAGARDPRELERQMPYAPRPVEHDHVVTLGEARAPARLEGPEAGAGERRRLLEEEGGRHERDVPLGDRDVLRVRPPLDVRLPRIDEDPVGLAATL